MHTFILSTSAVLILTKEYVATTVSGLPLLNYFNPFRKGLWHLLNRQEHCGLGAVTGWKWNVLDQC